MSDTLTDVAEDRSPRQRTFAGFACVNHGSDAHKHMLRRMLPKTHDPYKPAVIHWPALSPDALERPCLLPIRDVAVQAAGRASFPPANSLVTGRGPKAPAHRAMSCVKRPGTSGNDARLLPPRPVPALVPHMRIALRFIKRPCAQDTTTRRRGHDMDRR
jgi:hypothetical protein